MVAYLSTISFYTYHGSVLRQGLAFSLLIPAIIALQNDRRLAVEL